MSSFSVAAGIKRQSLMLENFVPPFKFGVRRGKYCRIADIVFGISSRRLRRGALESLYQGTTCAFLSDSQILARILESVSVIALNASSEEDAGIVSLSSNRISTGWVRLDRGGVAARAEGVTALADDLGGVGGGRPLGLEIGGDAGGELLVGGAVGVVGDSTGCADGSLVGAGVGKAGGTALSVSRRWGTAVAEDGSGGASSLAALRRLESVLAHLSGDGGDRGSGGRRMVASVASVAEGVFSVMGTVGVPGTAVGV
jgi:hypothetical protein